MLYSALQWSFDSNIDFLSSQARIRDRSIPWLQDFDLTMWDTSYSWVAEEKTDVLYGLRVSQRLLIMWQFSVFSNHVRLWIDIEVSSAGRPETDWLTDKQTNKQLTIQPTNCMEQNPSWGGNSSSVSQEIPHILWIPNVGCRFYKSRALLCILSRSVHSTPTPPILFLKDPALILLSHLRLGLQRDLFPSVSTLKPCMHFS